MIDFNIVTETFEIGDGRTITVETGKLARQADGAVLVRMGKAAVLATIVSAKEPNPAQSFFPLSVDYQEKFAAAGRIPGSFQRREGKLSDYEVLICRLVDRALRPLFPDGYMNETQVVITLVSSDPEVMPDSLAGFAASCALSVSDIPFNGPISEVRVARVNGEYIVNPSRAQAQQADIDILLAASEKDILMVEGESKECSEADLVSAIRVGHEAIKRQCQMQNRLSERCKVVKRAHEPALLNLEVWAKVETCREKIHGIAAAGLDKNSRKEGFKAIETELIESLGEEPEEGVVKLIKQYYHDLEKQVMREMVLSERKRLDGRRLDEIRPLHIEIDMFDSLHGCALFTRGETQSLTSVTLGTKQDEMMIDRAESLEFSKFLLHYNFPAFSTGEIRPNRGPGRREIGHGNLALRSLKQVMPKEDENVYTIRIVSDILESNGSSSMATVCAGSLALMDAGIPIKAPVSGIAMGLISEGDRYAVLSDILGDEDHLGDMDFKVTGTANGICGIQMDLKVDGLPYSVLEQALEQAKAGRLHILSAMNEVIAEARPEPKPHAPRIVRIEIPLDTIGAVIGPGGKIVQDIQRSTNTIVSIEETPTCGVVTIASPNKDNLDAAFKRVKGIVAMPEIGEIYEGPVKSITAFGAFIEYLPGKEGLLHISEVDWKRLENLDGIMAEGDIVQVKLLEFDKKTGKVRLSRKELLPRPEGYKAEPREPRGDRDSRDRDRDSRGGGDRRPPFNKGGGGGGRR
jgi:polyribonucleotide nucleotidyltransferase